MCLHPNPSCVECKLSHRQTLQQLRDAVLLRCCGLLWLDAHICSYITPGQHETLVCVTFSCLDLPTTDHLSLKKKRAQFPDSFTFECLPSVATVTQLFLIQR